MIASVPDIRLDTGYGRPARTPGLHLSDLLDYLDAMLGISRRRDGSFEGWNHAADAGFIWEDAMTEALRCQRLTWEGRPVNFLRGWEDTRDGILYTPDGIDLDRWIVWDFKLTWKSAANLPQDNWRWVMQMKSYCYAVGSLQAVLYPLYVCGSYRPMPSPVTRPTLLTFTQQELDEHWRVILQTRDAYLRGQKEE